MSLPRPTVLTFGLAMALALPLAAHANTKAPAKSSKSSPAKAASKGKSTKVSKVSKVSKAPSTAPSKLGLVLTEAQMLMAGQVHTGRADCEFKQFVVVERVGASGGSFRVRHSGRTYNMVPEETSTGAVRLVDKKTGVVWIQIPVKSMLLNHRIGQRIIDACASPAQRQAQAEADAAALAAASGAPGGAAAPPSMLGREDSIPAGIMYGPAAAASGPPVSTGQPSRL